MLHYLRSWRRCCEIQLVIFYKSELVRSTHKSNWFPLGSARVVVIVSGLVALKSSNVNREGVTTWRIERQAR